MYDPKCTRSENEIFMIHKFIINTITRLCGLLGDIKNSNLSVAFPHNLDLS